MSMRKRQEVQKMSRRNGLVAAALLLCGAVAAQAAILPEQFGAYQRVSSSKLDVSDRAVWEEYGLQAAERAEYGSGGKKVAINVWQLKDTTGAFAAQQLLQAGAVQRGNYVLRVEGRISDADVAQLQ